MRTGPTAGGGWLDIQIGRAKGSAQRGARPAGRLSTGGRFARLPAKRAAPPRRSDPRAGHCGALRSGQVGPVASSNAPAAPPVEPTATVTGRWSVRPNGPLIARVSYFSASRQRALSWNGVHCTHGRQLARATHKSGVKRNLLSETPLRRDRGPNVKAAARSSRASPVLAGRAGPERGWLLS